MLQLMEMGHRFKIEGDEGDSRDGTGAIILVF
jgi:hypothetical protein